MRLLLLGEALAKVTSRHNSVAPLSVPAMSIPFSFIVGLPWESDDDTQDDLLTVPGLTCPLYCGMDCIELLGCLPFHALASYWWDSGTDHFNVALSPTSIAPPSHDISLHIHDSRLVAVDITPLSPVGSKGRNAPLHIDCASSIDPTSSQSSLALDTNAQNPFMNAYYPIDPLEVSTPGVRFTNGTLRIYEDRERSGVPDFYYDILGVYATSLTPFGDEHTVVIRSGSGNTVQFDLVLAIGKPGHLEVLGTAASYSPPGVAATEWRTCEPCWVAGDARCCPSILELRRLKFVDGALEVVELLEARR